MPNAQFTALIAGPVLLLLAGCVSVQPGTPAKRTGDEIIVAGQLFHTGTRVITWLDPQGYDAYRTERLPANLLQAQRDYFGAHTYQRLDKLGKFHTQWSKASQS